MELISMHNGYKYKTEAHSVESALIQFHGMDIRINPDFTAVMENFTLNGKLAVSGAFIPVENYHMHFFFNLKDVDMVRQVSPCILNGSLAAYVSWASKITKRKIMIHVPKSNPWLKKIIERALMWVDGWEMVFSKNSHSHIFYVDSGDHYFTVNRGRVTYLALTWFMDDKMILGIDTRDKRGVI